MMVNRTLTLFAQDPPAAARDRWLAGGAALRSHGNGWLTRVEADRLKPALVMIYGEGAKAVTVPWPPRAKSEKRYRLASALGDIRDFLADLGWWAVPTVPLGGCALLIASLSVIEIFGSLLVAIVLMPMLYTGLPLRLLGIEDFATALGITWAVPLILLLLGGLAGLLRWLAGILGPRRRDGSE